MFKKTILSLLSIFVIFSLMVNTSKGDMQGIKVNLCDNGGNNNLGNINPGETKEICLKFTSQLTGEEEIEYGFSEGYMDTFGIQHCKLDQAIGGTNPFSKLFSNNQGNVRKLSIKGGETKEIKEKLSVPVGMSGFVYGCLSHKTVSKSNGGRMFSIVAQVQRYLNFFVGGDFEIKNSIIFEKSKGDIISTNNKIGVKKVDNNRISLVFTIKNNGNVSQNVKIKGTVFNPLGVEKSFETETKLLSPGNETNFKSDGILLPTYKGPFNISVLATAEPKFEFNADNISPEKKATTTREENGKIFIFTRLWVIVGLIALLVLIMILRPLFKKHKVE